LRREFKRLDRPCQVNAGKAHMLGKRTAKKIVKSLLYMETFSL
jgi:hypothetical protein